MSNTDDFKQSKVYQVGVAYEELGKLLQNPNTRIEDLVKIGIKYNVDFDFIFTEVTPSHGSGTPGKPPSEWD